MNAPEIDRTVSPAQRPCGAHWPRSEAKSGLHQSTAHNALDRRNRSPRRSPSDPQPTMSLRLMKCGGGYKCSCKLWIEHLYYEHDGDGDAAQGAKMGSSHVATRAPSGGTYRAHQPSCLGKGSPSEPAPDL